jgi:type IV pilus assembly protein PilW
VTAKPACRRLPAGIARPTGYSLIELMVAVTVTLLVVLGLTALFTNNSMARREIDAAGQQIENGRYTMELLRDDVRLAGYYGEFVPSYRGVTWQLPPNPCDPTLANLGWNATGTVTPVPISGFEGHDAAIAELSPQCIANRVPNSDVLVIRRTSTTASAPPPVAPNIPFLQVSLQSSKCTTTEAAFVLDVPKSPSPFTLKQRDCSTATLVRQYLVHVYYVATCDSCSPSDGIPTLKRVELAAGSMATTSLAQGIADMRVDYGLDTDNDGFPDTYRKCGASSTYGGPCTASDWANVMAVKVHLLTRNLEATPGYTDRNTYTMGLAGTLPAFGDADRSYRHHLYTTPIRIIGQSDLRELP